MKHNQSNCIETYDQPLYAKAMDIVLTSGNDILISSVIVRLGGFHLFMSFMSATGTIMTGSVIESLRETVYSANTVVHMMTGHACSRSLRAHYLTQVAIAVLVLEGASVSCNTTSNLSDLYDAVICVESKLVDVVNIKCLQDTLTIMRMELDRLANSSRTVKFWIQYYKQVEIMRLFVRAERSSDWKLHLYAVQQMVPYFHEAGHLNYAKYAHIYLQQMSKLHNLLSPLLYQAFAVDVCFTVKKSEKCWRGISSDMTIEQSPRANHESYW